MRKLLLVLVALSRVSLAAPTWLEGDKVLEQAYQALGEKPEALTVVYRPGGTQVAEGKLHWNTSVLDSGEMPRVRVEASVDGRSAHVWTIVFRRRQMVDCLVAAHDLPPGQLVTKDDIKVVHTPFDGPGRPLSDVNELLGRQTRRYLPAGTVLEKRDLVVRPIIERGQRVVFTHNSDGMVLTIEGKATRPGYPGRILPIKTAAGTTVKVWLDYEGNVRELSDSGARE